MDSSWSGIVTGGKSFPLGDYLLRGCVMEPVVLRVKPKARPYLEWLLRHLKDEIEVLTLEELEELEDLALGRAIEEGDKGCFVSEEEVVRALKE